MSHLSKVLKQMKRFPDVGITSPSVDEPGMDNPFAPMRKVVAKLEEK
jgi:hypothetical protein